MVDFDTVCSRLTFKQIVIAPIALALVLLASITITEAWSFRQMTLSTHNYEHTTRTLLSNVFTIKETLTSTLHLLEKNIINKPISLTEIAWLADDMIATAETLSARTTRVTIHKNLSTLKQSLTQLTTHDPQDFSEQQRTNLIAATQETLNNITIDLNQYHLLAHKNNMPEESNTAADLVIINGSLRSAIEALLRDDPDHKNEIIMLINSAKKALTPLQNSSMLASLLQIIQTIDLNLSRLLQSTHAFYNARERGNNDEIYETTKTITTLLVDTQSDLNWLTSQLNHLVEEHDAILDANMRKRELIFSLFGAIAMTLSIASLSGLFILLNRRIQILVHGTKQIANGHLDFRLPTSNRDEFSTLATSFNQMAQQLSAKDNAVKIALSDLSDSEKNIKKINTHLEDAVNDRTQKLSRTITSLEAENRRRTQVESELRLAYQAIEHINEAIIITDSQAYILDVNPAFSTITGFNRSEVIGQHCRFISAQWQDKALFRDMQNQLQKTGRWHGEVESRNKHGETFPAKMSISAIRDSEVITNYVGIFSDISDIKASEEKLTTLAFNDALTGLPNRLLFYERLEQACAQHRRQGQCFAVLFIDLDRFKEVNDTLGHEAGDWLLIEVSRRLRACTLRDTDTVARMGGDEFTVILTDLSRYEDCSIICRRIIDSISQPISIVDNDVHVGCSIGIAVYPNDGSDSAALTRHADIAMYNAKSHGRGGYKHFDAQLQKAVITRACIENDLSQALHNQEFHLLFQTIWNAEEQNIRGVEALIRWQHPTRGDILPGEFIQILEESGHSADVEEWILDEVGQHLQDWQTSGIQPMSISINVSAKQLNHSNLLANLEKYRNRYHFSPEALEIELTESSLMENIEQVSQVVRAINQHGYRITIDQFGTGYSSLLNLQHLNPDTLKIDRSFIQNIVTDQGAQKVVKAMLSMADSLDVSVIVAGVEHEGQLAKIKALIPSGLRVSYQGYLFSQPEPIASIRFPSATTPLALAAK